jgi:WD40 repeat protein
MRLRCILAGHLDDVLKASFSPDGQRVATCSYDSTLNVYDLNGNLLHHYEGHSGLIESFDWSRDGKALISCGTDGTIRTWDAINGGVIQVREAGEVDMDALVTLSDGSYVVGDNDGKVSIITSSGSEDQYQGHSTGVKRIIVDRSEKRLLSLGYDQVVVLWELGDGGTLREIKRSTYPEIVWARSAAFFGENKAVFATFGSTYAIWDLGSGEWDLSGIIPSVSQNAVAVVGSDVYSIGDSGVLYKNGKPSGGPGTLCNFLIGADGVLLTGGQTGAIFNAESGMVVHRHNAPLNCGTAFKRKGKTTVAIGSYSGHILFLTVEDGQVRYERAIKAHENAIKGISNDGNRLFSGCADGELAEFDIESLECVRKTEGAHEGILNGTCVFNDGFATVSRDLTLRLWKSEGVEVVPSRHKFSIKCIASNTSGDLIATGSYGGTIDVFDVSKKAWKGSIKRPTAAGISSVAWDDNRGHFLASSYDGSVYPIAAL